MDIDAPLRSLVDVRFGPGRVLARIDGPTGDGTERTAIALDAALQSMAVLTLADPTAAPGTHLPVSVRRVVRRGDPELGLRPARSRSRSRSRSRRRRAGRGATRGRHPALRGRRVLVRLEGVSTGR
ncbi:hypothetical protein A4U61_08730 [Streptomyces sp. H-KF8]|nr:hypothetical protein A4U61_08730 [Streptomyces sp. H-KF8]